MVRASRRGLTMIVVSGALLGSAAIVAMRQVPQVTDWTFLGPINSSGRANDVAVVDHDGRRRIYVGFAGGGLWRTDDLGATWTALFGEGPSTAIHTVVVAPSNPNVVWLLTGSTRDHLQVASAGAFKSVDAGRRLVRAVSGRV